MDYSKLNNTTIKGTRVIKVIAIIIRFMYETRDLLKLPSSTANVKDFNI